MDCVTGSLGTLARTRLGRAHFSVTGAFTWTYPRRCGTISPWPGALPGKDGRAMQGMQRKSWAWMLASHLLACMLLVFSGQAHAQRTEGDRAAASGPPRRTR